MSAILHTGNSVYTVLTLYIRIFAITNTTTHKQFNHYAVYTRDPDYVRIMRIVQRLGFKFEIHVMRTRFWVPIDSKYNSLFAVRCVEVSDEVDHSTGLKHISEI